MYFFFFFAAFQNGGKSEWSKLEQRSGMKFCMAEKCKPCEIYRIMHDVVQRNAF